LRRVICDRVAAVIKCWRLAAASGPDANGLYLAQNLASRKGKWTMKAGVVYPQTELGGDTGAVKTFAQAAEDLGYDHIVIYDHVLGAVHAGREPKLTGPYKENDSFHEPLITYAYLAGVTLRRGARLAGATSVVTMGANLNTVDRHIEAIKRWRDVNNSVR
jgi:hypothetical protein